MDALSPPMIQAHCRAGGWQALGPALLRRRLPADSTPALVAQWLGEGAARVGEPAHTALRHMLGQPWQLRALDQGPAGLVGWELSAGALRWALWCLPAPHTRLVHMERLGTQQQGTQGLG